MQRSTRIATALMMGAWLGACSEPASRTAGRSGSDHPGDARDARLAEPATPEAPVASDLEIGRRESVIALPHHVHPPRLAELGVKALVVVPRVVAGTQEVAEQQLEAVPLPEIQSHTIYLAPTGEMEGPSPVHVTAGPSLGGEPLIGRDYGGSRGPSIIIRGGMGGVDDKCDLRPHGAGGIAINRSVPPIGGGNGRGWSPRGGLR